MEQKINIPQKTDVSHLIALRDQLAIKSVLSPRERQSLKSLNVAIQLTESEYHNWSSIQFCFGEMCFLAFKMAINTISLGYRIKDPDLVRTFHNAFELIQFQKHCFGHLISMGLDVFGDFSFYASYSKKTKKDLYNELPTEVQKELTKQGLNL